MNFSRPSTSQKVGHAQQPSGSRGGDFLSDSAATLQESSDQPDSQHLLSASNHRQPNTMANNNKQHQKGFISSPSNGPSSSVQNTSSHQPAKKPRYYAHALTHEDKQALAVGTKNHNLKEYKDLVSYHESRRALVPAAMDKSDQTEALANIEREKQHSQRMLSKMARKGDDEQTYTRPQHASQSLYDLRSSSAPAPQLPPPELLSPLHLADPPPPLHERRAHARAASNGDYFSRPARPASVHPSSGHTSGTSSRMRSPLSQEVQQFQHNPETTFDSFLAPHKSGKGETHRDSDYAKKAEISNTTGSSASSPKSSPRLLSKMPSMPTLRKRRDAE